MLGVFRVDDFFAIIATPQENWHDEEEREAAKRFQNLVSTLKQNVRIQSNSPKQTDRSCGVTHKESGTAQRDCF